jgi:hypothetical protein
MDEFESIQGISVKTKLCTGNPEARPKQEIPNCFAEFLFLLFFK